jgi:hypothetical protein
MTADADLVSLLAQRVHKKMLTLAVEDNTVLRGMLLDLGYDDYQIDEILEEVRNEPKEDLFHPLGG